VLLICGVLTYVGVLEEIGTIDYVGEAITQVGAPTFAALLISYVGAIVSAFASSTGMLAATIPLAVPFLQEGAVGAIGVVTAVAISITVVDASPLSTNGPSSLPTLGTLIRTCSSATYSPTVPSWRS
jgi:Na+/H+ antiporter NhaD/arsenite permease-like protein